MIRVPRSQPAIVADPLMRSAAQGPPERYFLDELTVSGTWYLIPADRRADWYDFDALSEQTFERLPLPDYVRPVRFVRHFEFECPEEVL